MLSECRQIITFTDFLRNKIQKQNGLVQRHYNNGQQYDILQKTQKSMIPIFRSMSNSKLPRYCLQNAHSCLLTSNTRPQFNNIAYQFGSSKDQDGKEKKEDEKVEKQQNGPKVIQISKSQYEQMRKFVEGIKQSIPLPFASLNPFTIPKSEKGVETDGSQLKVEQKEDMKQNEEQPSLYFSSQQHQLSFQLLKLYSPTQFHSIFQQYQNSSNLSIKLMILYRYCGLGGTIGGLTGRLPYQYLQHLINSIPCLKQPQLQTLLQLYLTLHKQPTEQQSQTELPYIKTIEAAEHKFQYLLVKQPSHRNIRILVMLLRFWDIQMHRYRGQGLNCNAMERNGYEKILGWYQLQKTEDNGELYQNEVQSQQEEEYPVQELAYIASYAFALKIKNSSIPILLENLSRCQKTLCSANSQTRSNSPGSGDSTVAKQEQNKAQNCKISSKKIIRSIQVLLQNGDKIKQLSQDMKKSMEQLTILFQQCLSQFQKYGEQLGDDGEIAELYGIEASTGKMSALLHSCLLAVTDQSNNLTTHLLAIPILCYILKHPPQLTTAVSLPQYSQFWQSSMILYKLIKSPIKSSIASNTSSSFTSANILPSLLTQKMLKTLVDTFINNVSIQSWMNEMVRQDNGAVLQEVALEGERMLFQALVGYRMVVPNDSSKDDQQNNLNKQINERVVLRSLLTAYRKTIQTLHKTSLFSPTHIHNLIISCMISEAYRIQKGSESVSSNYLSFYLSAQLMQILRQQGSYHEKYGNYVKKLLNSYKL